MIRLELCVPLYHEKHDSPGWHEQMSRMRSRLLSALTAYAKRALGVTGVCIRLVRLEPAASSAPDPGRFSSSLSQPDSEGARCLGVVLVSTAADDEHAAGLDMEVAARVAKGIEEKEAQLMAELDGLVQRAEFCTDSRVLPPVSISGLLLVLHAVCGLGWGRMVEGTRG